MKWTNILISLATFILLFEAIKTQNTNNRNLSISLDNNLTKALNDLEKLFSPSKAFTALLMVYMVLIIAGAILVIVLIKPKIDN